MTNDDFEKIYAMESPSVRKQVDAILDTQGTDVTPSARSTAYEKATAEKREQVDHLLRAIYGRKYGLKGVGFGAGPGALSMDSSLDPTNLDPTKHGK
ncbi:MAG: hypothetical protein EOO71_20760 [Myxococcaceae bacterium]|nr:MAG: hypothetical protein EOO71_20760 [Myxococcaceae bacterium]